MSAAEPSRQFIDTNVLIYAYDQSAGTKHEIAKQLLTDLWENRSGCLSIQVLQEFYVKVTQKVAKPLERQAASQVISDLAAWQVHQPGIQDVLNAIQIQGRYQVSFWDAMVVTSALALDCDTLWSEDLNTGQRYETITIRNPFE